MACGMTNPKTFDNIDGTPIKYGSPGNHTQGNATCETAFWGKLVEWRDWLNAIGAWAPAAHGNVGWFGHSGFYVCKSGMHGVGRAMDLNFVAWSNGATLDLFNGNHAHPSRTVRRRYLSVDACSRRYFRYVLDGWYNAAHTNHIHQDDSTAVQFSQSSSSDVKFLQAVLVNFNSSSLAIDGNWGPATASAWSSAKAKQGFGDIWTSASNYTAFLTTVAVYGITDSSF